MGSEKNYTDNNGYLRGELTHSDLIHRQKAYRNIYLKHREKYPLPFKKYVVHHINSNKKDNRISNLQILTPEEHEKIHDIIKNPKDKNIPDYVDKDKKISKKVDEFSPEFIENEPVFKPGIKYTAGLKNSRSINTIGKTKKKQVVDGVSLIIISIILFLAVLLIITMSVIHSRKNNIPSHTVTNTPINPTIIETSPVEPFTVEGSKTDVIITNNQYTSISLNVTYRITSSWYGVDRQENKVFFVEENSQQRFRVYDNIGCNTDPCSVSIIDYFVQSETPT